MEVLQNFIFLSKITNELSMFDQLTAHIIKAKQNHRCEAFNT